MRSVQARHIVLLPVLLLTVGGVIITDSEAQVICQSNGCSNATDGCCTTSKGCEVEHTLHSEVETCTQHHTINTLPGKVERCTYNYQTFSYDSCRNSYHTSEQQTVGNYGKPNWVGAEFESVGYNQFSMTILWEHEDVMYNLSHTNFSDVKGYEIRIYEDRSNNPQDGGTSRIIRGCLCVTDPNLRNVSGITMPKFQYRSPQEGLSHMTVEVRAYPTLVGRDEGYSLRRNCSLLTGCAPNNRSEQCFSGSECYSWPQSCLDFLPSYNPATCPPPRYSPPTKLTTRLLTNNPNDTTQLHVSWEPPLMDYTLFPLPTVYYVSVYEHPIESYNTTHFRVENTTNIVISKLNHRTSYNVSVSTYVPCSGFHAQCLDNQPTKSCSCGLQAYHTVAIVTTPTTTNAMVAIVTTPTTTNAMASGHTTTVSMIEMTIIYVTVVPASVGILAIVIICILIIILIIKNVKATKTQEPEKENDKKKAPDSEKQTCVFILYPYGT